MATTSTNINLDVDLKNSLQSQELPLSISQNLPNPDTISALQEYDQMQAHPEQYKKYRTFRAAIEDVLADA